MVSARRLVHKLQTEISALVGRVVCLEDENAALRAILRAVLSGDGHNGRQPEKEIDSARKRVTDALKDTLLVSAAKTVIGQALRAKNPDELPIGWNEISSLPDKDTLQRCLVILEALLHNGCRADAQASLSRLAEQHHELWRQFDAILADPALFEQYR